MRATTTLAIGTGTDPADESSHLHHGRLLAALVVSLTVVTGVTLANWGGETGHDRLPLTVSKGGVLGGSVYENQVPKAAREAASVTGLDDDSAALTVREAAAERAVHSNPGRRAAVRLEGSVYDSQVPAAAR